MAARLARASTSRKLSDTLMKEFEYDNVMQVPHLTKVRGQYRTW